MAEFRVRSLPSGLSGYRVISPSTQSKKAASEAPLLESVWPAGEGHLWIFDRERIGQCLAPYISWTFQSRAGSHQRQVLNKIRLHAHVFEISTAYPHNDNWKRKRRASDNLVSGLGHVVDLPVRDHQQNEVLLIVLRYFVMFCEFYS